MFAKNLPKIVSNLRLAKASKMTPNVAKMLMAKPVSMTQVQFKSFANFDTIERAAQKLDRALEAEIRYENENYTQLEDIETFLNDSGFKFMEQESGLQMKLSKDVGNKLIEVVFESR